MKNWSGNQQWEPNKILYPSSEEEIIEIVQNAINNNLKIRTIGTGHSFTPLCVTNEILLSLDNFQGIISTHLEKKEVIVKAGTKLHSLSKELYQIGLGLTNLGDVDVQSIAGAISTGTHGTGITLGNISTQIAEITFINGKGEIVNCSENNNKELFKCAQISLGALGIITKVKIKCQPKYKLQLLKKKNTLNNVIENVNQYNSENRNYEFYWLPYTNVIQEKISNISKEKEDKDTFLNYFNDVILENYAFKTFCVIAKALPSLNKGISELSSKFISDSKTTKYSHQIYATPRLVKFNEMEYNIPYDAYNEVLKEIVKCVNSKKFNIHFPIENRFVAEDDIFLSPAYKRKSAYIACHVYKGKEYKKYFKALEEIFIAYEGRPHWGKLHTRDHLYFEKMYQHFKTFLKHRQEQDPNNIFINDHLKIIFGL